MSMVAEGNDVWRAVVEVEVVIFKNEIVIDFFADSMIIYDYI